MVKFVDHGTKCPKDKGHTGDIVELNVEIVESDYIIVNSKKYSTDIGDKKTDDVEFINENILAGLLKPIKFDVVEVANKTRSSER